MKLLLDQNISWKLVKQLEAVYPEIAHVKTTLSVNAEDRHIWQYAADNDFVIVSKDDDFEQRSILFGHPPKVIWVRLGNCKSVEIEDLLKSSLGAIENFVNDDEKSLLVIP